MFKCLSCGDGKAPLAYVVDTKQVLCRTCVGRVHFPGTKPGPDVDIEELDVAKLKVQPMTSLLLQVGTVVGMAYAVWRADIREEYFKGSSTCPALSMGRQALALYDANVFYYYKSTLASYCDIEDSFWRLLLDGWFRGVVSGSDSFLLLFSTLLKAWLFQSAVSTLVKPIAAVLYATLGVLLSFVIERVLNLIQAVGARAPVLTLVWNRSTTSAMSAWRLPASFITWAYTKNTYLDKVRVALLAVGVSDCVRLAVHLAGYRQLAALGSREASLWQLACEPLVFFFLAHRCAATVAKLDKSIWKKMPPAVVFPPTKWRKKPSRDAVEFLTYLRGRYERNFEFYKKEADVILKRVVNDAFHGVVVLRFLGICFQLAPVVRSVIGAVGMRGLLQTHADLFEKATGVAAETGPASISDRLLGAAFANSALALRLLSGVVDWSEWDPRLHVGELKQAVWRLALPLVLFFLHRQWTKWAAAQAKRCKGLWKGANWTNGQYADMLESYGSFWNRVTREEWQPPQTVYPAAAK